MFLRLVRDKNVHAVCYLERGDIRGGVRGAGEGVQVRAAGEGGGQVVEEVCWISVLRFLLFVFLLNGDWTLY